MCFTGLDYDTCFDNLVSGICFNKRARLSILLFYQLQIYYFIEVRGTRIEKVFFNCPSLSNCKIE